MSPTCSRKETYQGWVDQRAAASLRDVNNARHRVYVARQKMMSHSTLLYITRCAYHVFLHSVLEQGTDYRVVMVSYGYIENA